MHSDQYFLSKIAEEASEVVQRAMKAQQFGLGEVQTGQEFNNLERLVSEFHDLFVTFDDFVSRIDDINPIPTHEFKVTRLAKMETFLHLSQRLNQVDPDFQF